jgi:hypothetical protein
MSDDDAEIVGYDKMIINRPAIHVNPHDKGGIAFFFRSQLKQGVSKLSVNESGIVWVKLDKSFFGLESDYYLCGVYIPHERSTYYRREDIDFFEIIECDIGTYSELGKVCVFGDFNSRTSNCNDYIVNDNIIEFITDSQFSDDLPHYPERANEDKVINSFGKRLLQLCIASGMCIVNGRLHSDQNIGRYTCCTPQGCSAIDYVLLRLADFECVHEFKVCDYLEFSDHAPIYIALNSNCTLSSSVSDTVTKRVLDWDTDHADAYRQQLSARINVITSVVDSVTVNNVDCVVEKLSTLLYDVGFELFGKTVRSSSTGKATKPVKNKWFNSECNDEKRVFVNARNAYTRIKSDVNRVRFVQARSSYNRVKRRAKYVYRMKQGKELSSLAKKNPRSFWKTIKQNSPNKSEKSSIPVGDFFEHFKNLFASPNGDGDGDDRVDVDYDGTDVVELDLPIDECEIVNAIQSLKREKSAGVDDLVCEMFLDATDVIKQPLCTLFNFVFDQGVYPTAWANGIVVPVPKKGNAESASDYRGIAITSNLGKIFSIILNTRLTKWAENNDILCDNQFGFRKNRSTVDCIFILQSIISHTLANKEKLYCAFVDFRKAFDRVDRHMLWFKLYMSGVSTKMINIIKSMYSTVQLCVRSNGLLSNYFESCQGVKQGEPMSPLLFLLFVNDIVENFQVDEDFCVKMSNILLFIILFADDTVLFAKTPGQLQSFLDQLDVYCNRWNIEVNTDKTKIVVFQRGNSVVNNSFYYRDVCLVIVKEFVYLGLLLQNNGRFGRTQRRLAHQGRKAMYSLFSVFQNVSLKPREKCSMFDSMVASVLGYASEVWGYAKADDVEVVHNTFCKRVLCVKKSSHTSAVLGELGRVPLALVRTERMLKYWCNLLKKRNTITSCVYSQLRLDADNTLEYSGLNWAFHVKNILQSLGCYDVWLQQDTHPVSFGLLKTRLHDQHLQNWNITISSSPKLESLFMFKTEFRFEKYLQAVVCNSHRVALTKLRISSHNLHIETGRYTGVDRHLRVCAKCNMSVIENEYHFLLVCPYYSDLRSTHLPRYYCHWPNLYKFVNLLNTTNVKLLINLAKFVYFSFQRRNA